MRKKRTSSPGRTPQVPLFFVKCIYASLNSWTICTIVIFQHHFQTWSDQHTWEIHFKTFRSLQIQFVPPVQENQRQSLTSLGICNSLNNSISELYLDFANQDFTNDLIRFFKTYPGSNLKVLYDYNLKYRVIFNPPPPLHYRNEKKSRSQPELPFQKILI